eukprot:c17436_g1_i1.p1 GENE.c17436_g1_i1~~c17436_g1_i1.p1  ORF type:complete len:344 (+),score=73.96 c17436_g1_i1:398-1429(+)
MWWLGFFFDLAIAGAFTATSLSFADQMVLAPLSGLTLAFNTMLCGVFLREPVPTAKIIATGVIVMGITVTTVAGLRGAPSREASDTTFLNLNEIWELLQAPTGIAFFCVFNFSIVALVVFTKVNAHVVNPDHADEPHVMMYPLYVPLAFSTLAGMAGAQQQLCLKCLSELSMGKFQEGADYRVNHPFHTPYPYLILAWGIGVGAMQVTYVNEGMKRFHNTLFIPIYSASFILFNIVAGAVFFGEIKAYNTSSLVLFSAGAALAMFGQLYLLWAEQEGRHAVRDIVKTGRLSVVETSLLPPEEIQKFAMQGRLSGIPLPKEVPKYLQSQGFKVQPHTYAALEDD